MHQVSVLGCSAFPQSFIDIAKPALFLLDTLRDLLSDLEDGPVPLCRRSLKFVVWRAI